MIAKPRTVLHIDDVYKNFGRHQVLRGLNLSVDENSIVGLVGLNGSGKTTTIECLLGLQRFHHGTIEILGKSPTKLFELKGQVAAVFDNPCLHPGLTVSQHESYAKMTLKYSIAARTNLEDSLRLGKYQDFKTRKLSFGNKRRTAITQSLIGQPEFIVFDEPFVGLDAEGVEDVLRIVQSVNREHGTSFLLASHQLPYLERICTHVAILHDGRIAVHDRIENLLATDTLSVVVHSSQRDAIVEFAQKHKKITATKIFDDNSLQLELDGMSSSELNAALCGEGLSVSELRLERQSLNGLFREITNHDPTHTFVAAA